MRRLIINADDFGLTAGVNRAIIESHINGVVTSATLMANAEAFDDAIRLAKDTRTLGVGCHVVLVDGTPALPPDDIPDLIDPSTGHFYQSLTSFLRLVLRNRIRPGQIEAEAFAQIRKMQSAGVNVTHLDTHKHTHIFPAVLVPVLRAAQAAGITAIRNPFEPTSISFFASSARTRKRWLQVASLRIYQKQFLRATKSARVRTPCGTFGIAATGSLDERLWRLLLSEIPDGTWEFVCHPGYDDAELKQVRTSLHRSREEELHLFTGQLSSRLLSEHEIQLTSYRDLP
ncbi:MAG TPA: ChbG/HpnK family deacetylase [Terriglobales bacterium]